MSGPEPDPDADAGTVTWRELLAEAEQRLGSGAGLDARRIVEEASGSEGSSLLVALDERVTVRQMARFDDMVGRRVAGEPLQYVLGRWGFRHLDLAVDRRVLIPRPETEQLVDVALRHVDRIAADRDSVIVADLGTGSGAIALAVASERQRVEVWATERSAEALTLARANLAGLGRAARRVQMVEGSWFDPLPEELQGRLDVIASNPPYVATSDVVEEQVAQWEPAEALYAGPDGLDDLHHIVDRAPAWLAPGGAVVLELDPAQVPDVAARLAARGFTSIETTRDLAGRDRVISAVLAGPSPD